MSCTKQAEGAWLGHHHRMRPRFVHLLGFVVVIGGSIRLIVERGVGGWILGVFTLVFFGFGGVMYLRELPHLRPRTIPPPSPLSDERRCDDWFEDYDDPDVNPFNAADGAFVATLRDQARSLPAGDVDSCAWRFGDPLAIWVRVGSGPRLLAFGAHFTNGTCRGGWMPGEPWVLPEERSSIAFAATGSDDELIRRAIGWIDTVLRRPIERVEWWHRCTPYAVRYRFADTGEGLVEAFDRKFAPRRVCRRLRAAACARGIVRIDTSAIGEPHATVAVRFDGRSLPTPSLPNFDWYACVS